MRIELETDGESLRVKKDGKTWLDVCVLDSCGVKSVKPRSFQVGDFVECVRSYESSIFKGECGKVLQLDGSNLDVGVEFPTYNAHRHDLGGKTRWGHGHYLPNDYVKLIQ